MVIPRNRLLIIARPHNRFAIVRGIGNERQGERGHNVRSHAQIYCAWNTICGPQNMENSGFVAGLKSIHVGSSWFIASLVIAVIALYFTFRLKDSRYRYPPSPRGYNVFKGGHAYLLPPGLAVDFFERH